VPADFEHRLARALSARAPRRSKGSEGRAAAVLIPIVAVEEPALLLTLRTETVSTHKGQISFPGGSLEPRESPREAALREAQEEIGLDPGRVRVLGELDETPTFVSGYVITPVVGWVAPEPDLEPNPSEVADVIVAPIGRLSEWIYEGHIIWGVTARLLRMFLELLAEAGLGAPPGDTTSPWPTSR
jgi:8-oxo-dGTP pyrophosphatase MutT (NUDIX family)